MDVLFGGTEEERVGVDEKAEVGGRRWQRGILRLRQRS